MIENLGTTSQLTEKKCYYIVLCGKEHLSGLSKIPHKGDYKSKCYASSEVKICAKETYIYVYSYYNDLIVQKQFSLKSIFSKSFISLYQMTF